MRSGVLRTLALIVCLSLTGCPNKSSDESPPPPAPQPIEDAVDDATSVDAGTSIDDTSDTGEGQTDAEDDTSAGDVDEPEDTGPDEDVIEPECSADSDCVDSELGDGCCLVAACVEGQCSAVELEECCSGSNTDCDDGDAITADQCATTCVPGGCIHTVEVCPEAPLYMSKNFDDASLQFLVPEDSDKTNSVKVALSKSSAVSPKWSIYLGDPACNHYYNGPVDDDCSPADPNAQDAHAEELIVSTPTSVTLNAEEGAFLSFWLNMSAQPADCFETIDGEFICQNYDYLQVQVLGDPTEIVYTSTDAGALGDANTTNGEWRFQTVDLSPWAGQAIDVRFGFVIDGSSNYAASPTDTPWTGVMLDSIIVQGSCEDASCAGAGDACPEDASGCTDNVCTPFVGGGAGICAYQSATPGEACQPCIIAENCSDDPCYVFECNNGICEDPEVACCSPNSSFPVLTAPPAVAYEGFEDMDISDWTIEDQFEDDNISWQIDDAASQQGLYSLYFGDPETQTYQATPTNPATAMAWTPFFEVDTDVNRRQSASFWLWMSTEWDDVADASGDEIAEFVDVLEVHIQRYDESEGTPVWTSTEIGNTTRGDWDQVGLDLTEYRGETLRLGFSFSSGDPVGQGTANNYGGVRIDDFTIASLCGEACLGAVECSDGDACTKDWCELGECVNGEPAPFCCETDTDCDDTNSCTIDTCIEGTCSLAYDDSQANVCCSEGPWPGQYLASFEGDASGFTLDSESDPVVWHVTTGLFASDGESSMNFSNPETGNYANGVAFGRMISPAITVPPTSQGNPYATFSFALETEWDDNLSVDFVPEIPQDELRVRVLTDTNDNGEIDEDDIEEAPIEWLSHYRTNTTKGAMLDTKVDLDAYRGQSVQLMFEFDSGDDGSNEYAGPFIDGVSFGATCLPPAQVQCIWAGQCTPPDECKVSICNDNFKCAFEQKDTPECCEPEIAEELSESFDDTPASWVLESCTPSGEVTVDGASIWQSTNGSGGAGIPPKDGAQMLYFGNGSNYGGEGSGSCGTATSPVIELDSNLPWTVEFWLYLDIEKQTDCPGGGLPTSDAFEFRVLNAATGAVLLTWDKEEVLCSNYAKWVKREFDLTEFAGQSVRFEFSFDSYDDIENEGKGIAIDGLDVTRGCASF